MNVHVFGATSSPGCSNYVFKKTSTDYKDVYGFQASDTLQRNSYVDNLLKSVKSEEQSSHSGECNRARAPCCAPQLPCGV